MIIIIKSSWQRWLRCIRNFAHIHEYSHTLQNILGWVVWLLIIINEQDREGKATISNN